MIKNNLTHKRQFIVHGILLGLLLLTTVGVTIVGSAKGAEIAYLDQEKHRLIEENEELTAKIVSSNSIGEISEASETLGLIKPRNIIYLNQHETVASVQ